MESQLLDGDERAESIMSSMDLPARRSCMKSSNAEFRLTVLAGDDDEEEVMGDVIVEESLRALALKLSIIVGVIVLDCI